MAPPWLPAFLASFFSPARVVSCVFRRLFLHDLGAQAFVPADCYLDRGGGIHPAEIEDEPLAAYRGRHLKRLDVRPPPPSS